MDQHSNNDEFEGKHVPAGTVVLLGEFNPNVEINDVNFPFGVMARDYDPVDNDFLILVELDTDFTPIFNDMEWMFAATSEVDQVIGVIPNFDAEGAAKQQDSLSSSIEWREGMNADAARDLFERGERDDEILDAPDAGGPKPGP